MLNVQAALALAAPIRDPYEPNDDVDEVSPNGDRNLRQGAASDDGRRSRRAAIDGRVDAWEDPRDVFRVWLPAGPPGDLPAQRTRPTATSRSTATNAQTVSGRFAATGRLAQATARGRTERLVYVNRGAGRWAYLTVRLPARTSDTTYRLTPSAPPKPGLGPADAARRPRLRGRRGA